MTSFLRAHASKLGKLVAFATVSGGFVSYSFSSTLLAKQKNEMQFMSEPVTPRKQLESRSQDMKTKMELMVMRIQREVCDELARLEKSSFIVDKWERKGGGGGITCVMQDGK